MISSQEIELIDVYEEQISISFNRVSKVTSVPWGSGEKKEHR